VPRPFSLPTPLRDPARLIIGAFVVGLAVAAILLHLPLSGLLGDTLVRFGMNVVLVLSLVPMLRTGLGLNYGLPVGILAGLLGMAVCVQFNLKGAGGLMAAVALAAMIAVPVGWTYARVLLNVKGSEEVVGTFLGFSAVYLMAVFWSTAPFTNPKMLWPIGGQGLRPQVNLDLFFGGALDSILRFSVGGCRVPTGLLLFVLALCLTVWAYGRTRDGTAMRLVGANERAAIATGIDTRQLQARSVIQSTVLGAVGIVIYAQTYGFLQLYDAPLMMAFPAAAAILMGGFQGGRVTIAHVMAGAFVFNAILVFSTPVANELLVPELAEILRTIVTNGVILYALLAGTSPRKRARSRGG